MAAAEGAAENTPSPHRETVDAPPGLQLPVEVETVTSGTRQTVLERQAFTLSHLVGSATEAKVGSAWPTWSSSPHTNRELSLAAVIEADGRTAEEVLSTLGWHCVRFAPRFLTFNSSDLFS